MRSRKWFVLLILLGLLPWVTGCRIEDSPILRIAHEAELANVDPMSASDHISISILGNFYEGLVDVDRDMKLVPALALSWSTPDDRTWMFTLRPGVSFHDGSPLTSGDVKFTLDRDRSDPQSSLQQYLSLIDSIEAQDDSTVVIRTKIPDPMLAYRLTSVFIASRKSSTTISGRPVGTGPYRFVRFHSGILDAERFPKYWGGVPSIARIQFKTIKPGPDTLRVLKTREVDIVRWIPEPLVNSARAVGGFRIVDRDSLRALYLWMNSQPAKGNPFADRRVRLAIHLAVDRPALIRSMQNRAIPIWQLAPPGLIGYYPSMRHPEFSVAASRDLLVQAGYPGGFDTTLTVGPGAETLASTISSMLKTAGIRAGVEVLDWPTMKQKWNAAALPLFIGSWRFTSAEPSFFLQACLLTPQQAGENGWNPGYSNPQMDSKIRQYLVTFDAEPRRQILRELMEAAAEDLPLIPLLQRYDFYGVSEQLEWQPRQDGNLRANEMRFR